MQPITVAASGYFSTKMIDQITDDLARLGIDGGAEPDLRDFFEAEKQIGTFRNRVRNQKEKIRKLKKQLKRLVRDAEEIDGSALDAQSARTARLEAQAAQAALLARIADREAQIASWKEEREGHLAVIGHHANAAFRNLPLLNVFLAGLRLPAEATLAAAVRAIKKAKVNINIYDIVSRRFKPLYNTVKELALSIKKDGRIFPLELAKSNELKLFLRKIFGNHRRGD